MHIFFKLTDFYTGRLIKINNLIGDTEWFNRFIHRVFLFPIDQNFRTGARNTKNIFVVIQFKRERFIGHSKPQRTQIFNLHFGFSEHTGNQFHPFILCGNHIRGVELPQLFQGLKFIYLIGGLFICEHRQRI